MAHMWHNLYPSAQFHRKPSSFPSIQYHLLVLHLSYPAIKDELLQTIADTTSTSLIQVLSNLEFMFEFAIPTVCTVSNYFQFVVNDINDITPILVNAGA